MWVEGVITMHPVPVCSWVKHTVKFCMYLCHTLHSAACISAFLGSTLNRSRTEGSRHFVCAIALQAIASLSFQTNCTFGCICFVTLVVHSKVDVGIMVCFSLKLKIAILDFTEILCTILCSIFLFSYCFSSVINKSVQDHTSILIFLTSSVEPSPLHYLLKLQFTIVLIFKNNSIHNKLCA